MRKYLPLLLILVISQGCERSLVCVRNTPDWYLSENCSPGREERLIEVAYLTKHGKPLRHRRIYVQEVQPSDSSSAVNLNGTDLLTYSNGLMDARLCRFLLTDAQGRAQLIFDPHGVKAFSEDGIWSRGAHLFRFSRKAPPKGAAAQVRISQLGHFGSRRTAIVRVTLCASECEPCTKP